MYAGGDPGRAWPDGALLPGLVGCPGERPFPRAPPVTSGAALTSVAAATSAASASPVTGTIATVPIVLSLALAAWSLVATVRNRPPDRVQLIGLVVVEVALLALTAVALVALGGGDRPGEPGVFAGYLVTLVCLPPIAFILARMEPTRWGSTIVMVVCLVIPVVVVRLQQTWQVAGG